MPCLDIFLQQDAAYREQVLPKGSTKLAIEAGSSLLWQGIVGDKGAVVGMDGFGASAPAEQLFPYFGFSVENVVNTAKTLL